MCRHTPTGSHATPRHANCHLQQLLQPFRPCPVSLTKRPRRSFQQPNFTVATNQTAKTKILNTSAWGQQIWLLWCMECSLWQIINNLLLKFCFRFRAHSQHLTKKLQLEFFWKKLIIRLTKLHGLQIVLKNTKS